MKYCFVFSFSKIILSFNCLFNCEYILRIYCEHCAVSRVKISVRLSYQGSLMMLFTASQTFIHCNFRGNLKIYINAWIPQRFWFNCLGLQPTHQTLKLLARCDRYNIWEPAVWLGLTLALSIKTLEVFQCLSLLTAPQKEIDSFLHCSLICISTTWHFLLSAYLHLWLLFRFKIP